MPYENKLIGCKSVKISPATKEGWEHRTRVTLSLPQDSISIFIEELEKYKSGDEGIMMDLYHGKKIDKKYESGYFLLRKKIPFNQNGQQTTSYQPVQTIQAAGAATVTATPVTTTPPPTAPTAPTAPPKRSDADIEAEIAKLRAQQGA